MGQPLISVIIPIYKVEAYLDECVQSVISQTYINLEIILVDDGSPDKCPQMCDEYASQDSRIKVIHKINGGLSDARNAGISVASGDYIGFVDSDDCVSLDMYATLQRKIEKYDADIISCKFAYYVDGKLETDKIKPMQGYVEGKRLTLKDYFTEVVEGTLDNASWNKLYRRDIITEQFERGRINEDYLFFCQMARRHQDATIAFTDDSFYYYRQGRENSICADKTKLDLAVYSNKKEVYSDIESWHPALKPVLQKQLEHLLFAIIYNFTMDQGLRKKYNKDYKNLYSEFVKLPNTKIEANKVDVFFIKYCPSLYLLFVKARKRLNRLFYTLICTFTIWSIH